MSGFLGSLHPVAVHFPVALVALDRPFLDVRAAAAAPAVDAALAHLAGLGHLESLNLHGTRVGDAGLGSLERLPKLRSVYLWGSAVTPAGIERLRAARPDLQVDAGDSEPGTAPTPTP